MKIQKLIIKNIGIIGDTTMKAHTKTNMKEKNISELEQELEVSSKEWISVKEKAQDAWNRSEALRQEWIVLNRQSEVPAIKCADLRERIAKLKLREEIIKELNENQKHETPA